LIDQPTSSGARPGRLNIAAPPPAVSEETVQRLADVFQLLGDRSRLKIILTLAREGEQSVSALCGRLAQSQPAVSHHLKRLGRLGLLTCRRQGKNNFYTLTPGVLAKLLEPLFAQAGACREVQLGGLVLALRRCEGKSVPSAEYPVPGTKH
jgi:ArsR family transcriptional regulator, arsenate/arsenite/antimonite-responsive transcriptional repressor